MKGILLCGGTGSRLRPATLFTNKSCVPVLTIPMIFFPLRTLVSFGITEILIVTNAEHVGQFVDLLGDGSAFGLDITYRIQRKATGIAAALKLAKTFAADDLFAVILGDNFFEETFEQRKITGPTIFTKLSKEPERFGVYDLKSKTIVEKPAVAPSRFVVTGLYFYTPNVFHFVDTLTPSARGELEITDVNNWYLSNNNMDVMHLKKHWSDMGTVDSKFTTEQFLYRHMKSKPESSLSTFLKNNIEGSLTVK